MCSLPCFSSILRDLQRCKKIADICGQVVDPEVPFAVMSAKSFILHIQLSTFLFINFSGFLPFYLCLSLMHTAEINSCFTACLFCLEKGLKKLGDVGVEVYVS